MHFNLISQECNRMSIILKSFSAYDKMSMPPPNAPINDPTGNYEGEKYIQSREEALDDKFKADAELSGFETAVNPSSFDFDPNPQFFPPPNLHPYYNNGEVPGFGKVSQFHPICCKVQRLMDDGIERKQIEKYISGSAHTISSIILFHRKLHYAVLK